MKFVSIMVALIIALLSWGAISSESRFCGEHEVIVVRLTEDGEAPWFSYRPQDASHRGQHWHGEDSLTRIAPTGDGRWCILGGGDQLEIIQ